MIQKFFLNVNKLGIYFKKKLFHERIEYKKIKYKRENERDMEIDEIEEYKFKLFIFYSLIASLPLMFFITVILGS